MQNALKYIAYLIAGVIALLLITIIVLGLIPSSQYKQWITSATESATGRVLSIDEFELDIGKKLKVSAENLRLANASWSKQKDMLTVSSLDAEIGLLDVLVGNADIRLVVGPAEMLAEKNEEGVSNWSFKPEAADEEREVKDEVEESGDFDGLPLHPVIHEIRIDDFKLTQLGKPGAEARLVHLKQLLIEAPEKETTVLLTADLNGRPVKLTGNLGDMQRFINGSSEPLNISGDLNGNTLNISGNWGPLFPSYVMDLDFGLKIPTSQKLAELAGITVEEFAPIEVTGKIIGDGEKLTLNPFEINLDDPTAELRIKGSVDDLLSGSGIKIDTDANSDSLETLFKQLHIELPMPLPPEIDISAEIKGGLKNLELGELVVVAKDKGVDLKMTSSIGNLMKLEKINVNLDGNIDSLSSLSRYAKTELPQTKPLKLTGKLTEDDASHPVLTLRAESGDANVDINSTLDSLKVPEELQFDIAVKAAKMSDFDLFAQKAFHDKGPLDVSAKVKIAKSDIAVDDLVVQLDEQTANGNLAFKFAAEENKPAAISGKIDIDYLNLDHFLPKPAEVPVTEETPPARADVADDDEGAPAASSDRLFSSEPILRDQLNKFDIDFAVNANKFEFGKSAMSNVQLAVLLKEGMLTVEPIKAAGSTGNINGVVRIDGRSKVPSVDVDLSILQMPMPNLGGALDFDVDLDGQGDSVAALMASLNGRMLLVVRDGKIEQSLASNFGTGLLSFSEDKDYTELECGILRVDVKDGIANFDDRLAAQLTEVTWMGGGEVNLKTEELGIGVSPKPRKGIPISAGSLASLVYVGGTLKNPKVQLDPKDVAVKYAKYSAHVATGGVTYLLEKLKERRDANEDVCEMILDGTVFDDADKAKEKEKKKAEKAREEEDAE